jgi:hypothetical protein
LGLLEWLSVLSGIIGVLSFIFAVWVWMRTDMKVRELTGALQTIYDISGNILWETINLTGEDAETRLRQAERAVGLASSIHTLSSKYAAATPDYRSTEIGVLVERGVIVSQAMLTNIETSPSVKEVWLVTPDLEPDLSEAATGAIVSRNIRNGKRYVYFVPTGLQNLSDLTVRLRFNVGAGSTKSYLRNLQVIPIETTDFPISLGTGNMIFFFKTDSASSRGEAFREIVLTRVADRGIFWQECTDAETESVYQFLRRKIGEKEA